VSQAAPVTLHVRDETHAPSVFFSRDDAKFLRAAPFLLGTAMLLPNTRWHKCANWIESGGARPGEPARSPVSAAVAAQLGVSEEQLRDIVAASRVNRTEHLIHVMHSLLRPRWRPGLEIAGRQHLDDALARGKGAVLWVAHFAFASLFTKMALADAGYRVSHVSRPEHGVSKSRFGIRYLNGFRVAAENRHLVRRIVHRRQEPSATRQAALAALGRNELLSITVGAWEGRHLATGALLGSRYTVATGAPGLAFASGASLLPVFTTRDRDGGAYRVAVGAPLGESGRSSGEEFVYAATFGLLLGHEAAIRACPEQWRGWSALLK